jgi:hypothetical protein
VCMFGPGREKSPCEDPCICNVLMVFMGQCNTCGMWVFSIDAVICTKARPRAQSKCN